MIGDILDHTAIKVFIIDRNAIETMGLSQFLEDERNSFKVVGTLPSTERAVDLISSLDPNLLLLGIASSNTSSSLEFIKEMKAQFPLLPIVVITSDTSIETILTALKNGAVSYLLDSTTSTELKDALLTTILSGSVLSPEVAHKVIANFKSPHLETQTATGREVDILKLIALGVSNKEIGQKLLISTRTVEAHLNHMYTRFDVSTRTQAVLHALRYQLIQIEDPAA